MIHFQTGVVS